MEFGGPYSAVSNNTGDWLVARIFVIKNNVRNVDRAAPISSSTAAATLVSSYIVEY